MKTENIKSRVKSIDGAYSPRKIERYAARVSKAQDFSLSRALGKALGKLGKRFKKDKGERIFLEPSSRKMKKSFLRKAIASMVIFSVLATAYFQNTNRALSATYTWTQTNWNSETANNTGHPAPADWTEYSAKDASVTAGSTVTLTASSGSNIETLDADFDGTHSNTVASSNSVMLSPGSAPYSSSGNYTSGSIDLGQPSDFSTLNATGIGETMNAGDLGSWTSLSNGSINAGSLISDPAGAYLYGSNNTNLRRYSVAGDSWSTLSAFPQYGAGHDLVYVDGYIYEYNYFDYNDGYFNRYSVSDNSWETLTNHPVGRGGSISYPGYGDYIYAIRGETTNGFYRYSITNNQWESRTNFPGNTYIGNDLVSTGGDYLYATQGCNGGCGGATNKFYRYTISTNTWSDAAVADAPSAINAGGDLSYPSFGDYIYALKGDSSSDDFWAYSISNNNWTTLDPADNTIAYYDGSALGYANYGGYIYASNGSNFKKYQIPRSQIILQIAANNDNSTWNYIGPDGTASSYFTSTGQAIPSSLDGNRYVKYKLYLATGNTSYTPSLDDITINYNYYLSSQTLTSSKYDTTDAANVLAGLLWTENLPSGTDVKFQARTADAENGTWTNWCGPDNGTTGCDTGTYFTDPTGSETPDADMMDGSNDRWIQYRATLTSTGVNTPTLSDVTMEYVVNATPAVTVNSATQNSDGTISINYNLSDADSSSFTVSVAADIGITLNETLDGSDTTITLSSTALLPTSGTIQIDSEQISYTGKSGNDLTGCARGANNTSALTHSSAAVIWAKATTTSGNIGGSQTTGNGKTISWTINTDYDGVYRNASQGKIRVSANDGDAANQVGNGDSAAFIIDTKDPVPADPAVIIDASTDPAAGITLSASDDSSIQMKVGLAADLSDAAWEAYSTSKILDLVDEPETVYAQFKDAYENTSIIVSNITPTTPTQAMVQDNSNMNVSPPEYRLFISWQTIAAPSNGFAQYNILRSTDDVTYSTLTTISSRTTNFYMDESVAYNTDYYYKISSQDNDGNISYLSTAQGSGSSAHGKANGVQDAGEGSAALTAITMLYNDGDEAGDPKVLTDIKAVIAFNTDQLAKCTIEYGTEAGNYTEVPVTELSYNVNHSMHLTGLIFDTQYFYQITCEDLLENTISTIEYDFTTLEEQFSEAGEGTVGEAPEISGLSVTDITGESALAEWTTNENTNSLVKYGITADYGKMAGDGLVNSDEAEYLTSHQVVLEGLIPDTKYYLTAISVDTAGNITESTEETFTTSSISKFNTINVASDNLGEVLITWITDEEMSSIVEYGLTTSYGDNKESSSKTDSHSITLSGLKTGEMHHFRLKGEDTDGNIYASADYTFMPKSPPKISNIKIDSVSEHEAKVTFNTDIPADTLITYANIANTDNAGSQGDPKLTTTHEIELKNLLPGTTYAMVVRAKDEQGNETQDDTHRFTTGKDENPPIIEKIRTESALAQSDKVQSIIYWNTDEPSTTSLIYKEGQSGQEKEILFNGNLSLDHVVVITAFKPGTVYYFKVKSIDAAKNEAISTEHAILTPQRKENIIQIIINNFQDIFGWARF